MLVTAVGPNSQQGRIFALMRGIEEEQGESHSHVNTSLIPMLIRVSFPCQSESHSHVNTSLIPMSVRVSLSPRLHHGGSEEAAQHGIGEQATFGPRECHTPTRPGGPGDGAETSRSRCESSSLYLSVNMPSLSGGSSVVCYIVYTHSLTHPLTHPLTHTLTHSLSLTHSHTHPPTHSHTHPPTHSLTGPRIQPSRRTQP